MKLEEKNKAQLLRLQGFSINQIVEVLNVSKGSVSAWVRDVEIPWEFLQNINNRLRLGREQSRKVRLINIANRNLLLEETCKKEILPFSKRDLRIAGLMLYAGEGSKTEKVSNQHIELANSDPNILRIFINFLTNICSVPKEKIKIRLILYSDIDIKEAQGYWSKELEIPLNQFQKEFIKQSFKSSAFRHLRRAKYGTAHINVYDVNIYRKVVAWIKAIYGYNRDELGE
jgi:transcriptional regulator with XRE-family HTH domain